MTGEQVLRMPAALMCEPRTLEFSSVVVALMGLSQRSHPLRLTRLNSETAWGKLGWVWWI